jgi:leucyl aminopeptidase
MKFTHFGGPPADAQADLLAVPVFSDKLNESAPIVALDERMGGVLRPILDEESFKGKPQQSALLHTQGKLPAKRVLFIGLGAEKDMNPGDLRHAGARAARAARSVGAKTVAVVVPAPFGDERALQFLVEGVLLGRYRFDRYLTGEDARKPDTLEHAIVVGGGTSEAAFARVVRRGEIVAAAVSRARDWVNEPAGALTPRRLAAEAESLAQAHGIQTKVLGPAECRELGMGMYLAVAQGSDEEPRFIHLTYKPKTPAKRRVCIIGKGVTFDSGGLSLKPSNAMEDMKIDMAGAAAVLSSVIALAELESPVEVHAIAACTENMPSGKAYKLGDVLRSMAGKTVEINNTDAEGRLTLGDALTYALKLEPDEVFDFATLTGACVVALGPHFAGVMGNDAALSERWLAAAKAAGEEMWPLPLPERLKEMLKSDVADMKNTGERYGGALTAGLFLKEFAGSTPWVHVDIAGPASSDKEYGAFPKGGTGFAVATLLEYLGR